MKLADVISNAGYIMGHANQAAAGLQNQRNAAALQQQAIARGLQQEELARMAMEKARRDQALEAELRAVAPKVIPGQPAQDIMEPDHGNDVVGQVPEVPESQVPDFEGRAAAYLRNGRPDLWSAEKAKAKGLAAEGLVDLSRALLTGEDPAAAVAKHYNSRGNDKIDPASVRLEGGVLVGKRANGQPFRLDPNQVLQQYGGMKPPESVIVPQGGKLVRKTDGTVIAEGTPKKERDPFLEKEHEYELKERLERFKASLEKGKGGKNEPREQQLARAFVEAGLAGDMAEGLAMAMEGKNISPGRFRASLITSLARDNPDIASGDEAAQTRAKKAIEKAADELTQLAFPKRAAPAAPAPAAAPSEKAPAKEPAKTVKDPRGNTLTYTGQRAPDGRPIYQDASGRKFLPKGA